MTLFSTDIEREFAIDRTTMWQLWTTAEHASRWMRPSLDTFGPTIASVDAGVGGAYRFEMVTGDETHTVAGTFLAVDPVEHLSYTWAWEQEGQDSVVDVRFSETPTGTLVRIHHSQLDSQASADQHAQGWAGCLTSLAAQYDNASA